MGKLLTALIIAIVVIGGLLYSAVPDLFIQRKKPVPPQLPVPVPIPPPQLPAPVPPPGANDCIVTGCSGQICSDQEVITTCEWKKEYACYRNARCERQANGQCGWTLTLELQQCLGQGNTKTSTASKKTPVSSSPPPAQSPPKQTSLSPSPKSEPTAAVPVPSSQEPETPSAVPAPPPEPLTYLIIFNSGTGFEPSPLTIARGDTVIFKNNSSQLVWPASDSHPTHAIYPSPGGCIGSTFDACRGLGVGDTWSFRFDHAGTWQYHDHLNPRSGGTIFVK